MFNSMQGILWVKLVNLAPGSVLGIMMWSLGTLGCQRGMISSSTCLGFDVPGKRDCEGDGGEGKKGEVVALLIRENITAVL